MILFCFVFQLAQGHGGLSWDWCLEADDQADSSRMLVEAWAPAGVSGPLLKMLSLGFLLGSPYSTLPGCFDFSQANLGLCEMDILPHLCPLHFIR